MISGSIVALVTPMLADGSVDWQSLEKLIGFHIENQTDAIVAVGTTGESATLSPAEHCEVIKFVVQQVSGRIPVIAGTGANSTSEAIELTEAAKRDGADACLLVAPYYNKPTQEGLFLHHKAIAEAVSIPQILYNVPGRTAVDMSNDTVSRLADIDNIIAIKDATGDIPRGKQLIEQVSSRIDVYSGDDETAWELMLAGAKGNISVTANVRPKAMHDLCHLAMSGDAEKAKALNERLMVLHNSLFVEANPIPVKFALEVEELIGSGIRLPLTRLSQSLQAGMIDALSRTKELV